MSKQNTYFSNNFMNKPNILAIMSKENNNFGKIYVVV